MTKFVKKDWGYEEWFVNNELYCGKRLVFESGQGCSFHYHAIKHETFLVETGPIIVQYIPSELWDPEDRTGLARKFMYRDTVRFDYLWNKYREKGVIRQRILHANETLEVPPCTVHRMYALPAFGISTRSLIEFSTHHDEVDSYRIRAGDLFDGIDPIPDS